MILLGTLFADESLLGRLEYASLSQQSLMEMLVVDIRDNRQFQEDDGGFLPIETWRNVTLMGNTQVIDVQWNLFGVAYFYGGGSIDLQWLPSSITSFNISANKLIGTLDTQKLSIGIRYLNLTGSRFHGEVRFDMLPDGLEAFHLSDNEFCGSVELNKLPASMRFLGIDDNHFKGRLVVDKLFTQLKYLNVRKNRFSAASGDDIFYWNEITRCFYPQRE